MPSETNPSSRDLPKWLIALLLLLLLVGGGWGVWRYFEGGTEELSAQAAMTLTDPRSDAPPIPREPGQGRRFRQGQGGPNFAQFAAFIAANMPDGVMATGNGYLVKAGTVRLDIDRPSRNGDWRYRFSYAIRDMYPPDQIQTLRAARLAVNDAAAAEKAGVTAAEIQQLRGIPWGGAMVVDQPDHVKISALFKAWLSAAGRSATIAPTATSRPITAIPATPEAKAAEQQLVAALTDMGNRQLGPTKQNYADRAQHVRTILGDGLLQKLKPAG